MKDKVIGVLMGGVSRERAVSLRSGKNVAEALRQLDFQVKEIDISSKDCREQIKLAKIDIAFNVLHGTFGEDGGIQQALEDLQISYTGSGVKASQGCMNKVNCKKILVKNNLPTPKYQEPQSVEAINLAVPVVIKPCSEGSSFGVNIVKEQTQLAEIFEKTRQEFGPEIFLEEMISGTEVTIGIIKKEGKIIPLPILELVPKNEFYDFHAKYTPGQTEFILPARIGNELTQAISESAVRAYQVLQCDGAIRIDFLIDRDEKFYIIDVNTVPGMTQTSDLPAEAKEYGLSFEQLVGAILESASINKY